MRVRHESVVRSAQRREGVRDLLGSYSERKKVLLEIHLDLSACAALHPYREGGGVLETFKM